MRRASAAVFGPKTGIFVVAVGGFKEEEEEDEEVVNDEEEEEEEDILKFLNSNIKLEINLKIKKKQSN